MSQVLASPSSVTPDGDHQTQQHRFPLSRVFSSRRGGVCFASSRADPIRGIKEIRRRVTKLYFNNVENDLEMIWNDFEMILSNHQRGTWAFDDIVKPQWQPPWQPPWQPLNHFHLLLQIFGMHCQIICRPFQLCLLQELSNITYSCLLSLTVERNLVRSNQLNVSHFVIQR